MHKKAQKMAIALKRKKAPRSAFVLHPLSFGAVPKPLTLNPHPVLCCVVLCRARPCLPACLPARLLTYRSVCLSVCL